jgi:hypothetical protein
MCSESVAEQLSGVDDVKTTQSVAEKREERPSLLSMGRIALCGCREL